MKRVPRSALTAILSAPCNAATVEAFERDYGRGRGSIVTCRSSYFDSAGKHAFSRVSLYGRTGDWNFTDGDSLVSAEVEQDFPAAYGAANVLFRTGRERRRQDSRLDSPPRRSSCRGIGPALPLRPVTTGRIHRAPNRCPRRHPWGDPSMAPPRWRGEDGASPRASPTPSPSVGPDGIRGTPSSSSGTTAFWEGHPRC